MRKRDGTLVSIRFAASVFAAFAAVGLFGCGGGGGGGPFISLLNIYTVGGTITGLSGTVVLQNNSGNNLAVSANGAFTFTTPLATGSAYAVTVLTQPISQTCTVTGGSGTVGAANVTSVAVNCISVAGSDPLFTDQWHLQNTGQAGGTAGEDVNVAPVWNAAPSIKGTGVRIAVVDDGLEIAHEDLSPNVVAGQSFNYVNMTTNPTHVFAISGHGTSVGGVAAARDLNGLGGAGAAPRAGLVGYNLLENFTSTNEADAMTRNAAAVFVSNNSWGAPDGTGHYDASAATWRTAINTGLSTGRNGRGIIYTWAAGNGGTGNVDNSNYDGQANYRGVIAVGAVNDKGVKSSYSERGANLWVSAPAGEFCTTHTITTTDRTGAAGDNDSGVHDVYGNVDYADSNYTKCFNGTSSAAPLAAGVIALVLEANPNLTWRDLRLVLAQSARKNDPLDPGWTLSTTTPAYNFNHNYGFGVADANAAVTLAKTWVNVGAQVTFATATATVNTAIPDNNTTGVSNTINVAGSGIGRIEFVEINFNTNHTYVGDLDITLTAPSGTVSRLNEVHGCAGNACPLPGGTWRFGSARHLGEAADGNWKLTVSDLATADTGIFTSWQLTFYGRLN